MSSVGAYSTRFTERKDRRKKYISIILALLLLTGCKAEVGGPPPARPTGESPTPPAGASPRPMESRMTMESPAHMEEAAVGLTPAPEPDWRDGAAHRIAAGGAYVDSRFRAHGLDWYPVHLVVIDGQAVGLTYDDWLERYPGEDPLDHYTEEEIWDMVAGARRSG